METQEGNSNSTLNHITQELKTIIIEVSQADPECLSKININLQLFNNPQVGVTLDSLDAVEISMQIHAKWGIRIKDISSAKQIFFSLATMAQYVFEHAAPPKTVTT